MKYEDAVKNAKNNIGGLCRACNICNGAACRNTMPGPGAKGTGDTAVRNFQKWQEIRVNMDTICPMGETDTSLEIFGENFRYPFFAGPVGAVNLHYSDAYDDISRLQGCHKEKPPKMDGFNYFRYSPRPEGGSLGYSSSSKLSNGPLRPERWSLVYSTFSSTSLSISFLACAEGRAA